MIRDVTIKFDDKGNVSWRKADRWIITHETYDRPPTYVLWEDTGQSPTGPKIVEYYESFYDALMDARELF